MIGKIFSHYQIEELLGVGMMSAVYKALDVRLNRSVVLKFLPPYPGTNMVEKEQLIFEAKTASALDHPNICTIYEIEEFGQQQVFIAMAYYPGETLREKIGRGPLSLSLAFDIAAQVARGLAAAHGKGIVHRDIKPANLIVTPEGLVKILDFGVAKLEDASGYFKDDVIVGTPSYMSPEQAHGKTVNHLSDVWSLGIVFYQMLTGKLPFKYPIMRPLTEALDDLIKICAPAPDELPVIQTIIEKTLVVDPAGRFQNISEMAHLLSPGTQTFAEPLHRDLTAAPPEPLSIAVMPFKDKTPGNGHGMLCDVLTEEIINTLSRVKELRVVSRASCFQFKGKEIDVKHVGEVLRVGKILEGIVYKAGANLRILVELTNVVDSYAIWAGQYERPEEELFHLQSDIARTIVGSLKGELLKPVDSGVFRNPTPNNEAYNAYLQGRYHWNKRTISALKKSTRLFRQAIASDPNYALAYSGLADVYLVLGMYGACPPGWAMPRARQAAQKALENDARLIEPRISLACLKAVYNWDWQGAETAFRESIALAPNYAIAHHWFAINHLIPTQRFGEALQEVKYGLRSDPISLIINATVGVVLYYTRQYDLAIEHFRKTLEMDENFAMTHFFLGQVYAQKGEFNAALDEVHRALRLFGDSPNLFAGVGYAAAVSGKKDVAEKVINALKTTAQSEYVSPYYLAAIYAGMGDAENAFAWLDQAYRERAYQLLYVYVDPMMDPIRPDPRYANLLKKMNFTA